MSDRFQELTFPYLGIDQAQSQYDGRRENACQIGDNVRTYEALTGRGRGGSRAGLSRLIDARANGIAAIQDLNTITSTSADALADSDQNEFYPDDVAGGFNNSFPLSYPGDDSYTPPGGILGGYGYLPSPTTPSLFQPRIPTFGNGVQPKKPTFKTPKVTWNTSTVYQNGTVLGGTTLNATWADPNTGATLAGTTTYSPPSGTTLTPADTSLRVLFVPDDTATYRYGRIARAISVFDWFTSGGHSYPTTPALTFTWGANVFQTLASHVSTILWSLPGPAYTLVDLDHGASGGTLVIGTGLMIVTTSPSNIVTVAVNVTQPSGTSQITQQGPLTTLNPLAGTVTLISGLTLTATGGGTETHDLTVAVSGPTIV